MVSNKPTTVITGIISNLPVPFPAEKDTCAHQTQCPIQAGKQSVFTITLPVLKSYPHVSYGMLPVMDLQCCFNSFAECIETYSVNLKLTICLVYYTPTF